jgi:hypothetical protein
MGVTPRALNWVTPKTYPTSKLDGTGQCYPYVDNNINKIKEMPELKSIAASLWIELW